MKKLELTPDELKLVQLYARMQAGVKPRWPVWLIEIGAPVALAIVGLVIHKPVYLGAAIVGLIVMNANRMFKQFKYAHQLKSVCLKVEAHVIGEQGNV